jgi:hypothetical protein
MFPLCPACDSHQLESFYRVNGISASTCVLLDGQAVAVPGGSIDPFLCPDPVHRRPEFRRGAHRALARHGQSKNISEIGHDHSEFLQSLRATGGNRDGGSDPCHELDGTSAMADCPINSVDTSTMKLRPATSNAPG